MKVSRCVSTVEKLWPDREPSIHRGSARHVTTLSAAGDWSVIAGNKNTISTTFRNFTFSISLHSKHALEWVWAGMAGRRFLRWAPSLLWGMSFAIFLLSCFPESNVGMGTVLRCEALFSPLPFDTALLFSLLACVDAADEPGVTADC